MSDEGGVGGMRSSTASSTTIRGTTAGRNNPAWILTTPDDHPGVGVATTAAALHSAPGGRMFPTDDVVVSPSSGRRGTGAFLPCVQTHTRPIPQPVPRPSGKPAKPNSGAGGGGNNKKKPRPSPPTSKCGGGPGMHVVFIDSSSRPSGTGVFLPRSSSTDQLQLQQQHNQHGQRNKPSLITSSPVLLPARVVHLLTQRITDREAAKPAGSPGPHLHLGTRHLLTTVLRDADTAQQEPQQDHPHAHKPGTPVVAAAAGYQHVDPAHASTTTAKCSVPLHDYYTSSALIEKLLPEEWSY